MRLLGRRLAVKIEPFICSPRVDHPPSADFHARDAPFDERLFDPDGVKAVLYGPMLDDGETLLFRRCHYVLP